MGFGEKIKALRINKGMTLEEVGNIVGVGKSTVRKWESGEIANMRRDKIALLAKALGVTPGYLMGWEESDQSSRVIPTYPNLIPIKTTRLPILGPVAAGTPIVAEREYEEYVDIPVDIAGRADAALNIEGDSMEPKYMNGDIVLIRYQDDVDDGQIAAVCIDDTVTLKKVYHIPNGVCLVSENKKYKPMTFTLENADNIHLVGIAVGFLRWDD